MDVVFPTSDAVLPLANGNMISIRRGQHWSAADEAVKQHPGHFSTDPRYGLSFTTPPSEMAEPPVEQATAAPGERRRIRG